LVANTNKILIHLSCQLLMEKRNIYGISSIIVVIHYLHEFSFNYMSKYVDHILQLSVTYRKLSVLNKLRSQYSSFGCFEKVSNSKLKNSVLVFTHQSCVYIGRWNNTSNMTIVNYLVKFHQRLSKFKWCACVFIFTPTP
jgi:hypothetical protein